MTPRETIAAALLADPALSDRAIAERVRASSNRTSRVRRDLEAAGVLPTTVVRVGRDGRRRAARGLRRAVDSGGLLSRGDQRHAWEQVLRAAKAGDLSACIWILDADQRARAA